MKRALPLPREILGFSNKIDKYKLTDDKSQNQERKGGKSALTPLAGKAIKFES